MEATMHGDGASLFVAQRLNSNAHPPMRSPSTKPETVSPRRSAAGFLLLDSSLRPIAFNPEALRVLSYPNELANGRRPDVLLAGKIRQTLLSPRPSRESPLVTEFRSGRRRYLCRRSEEHTSELQSRGHLVCRLLLEKKKISSVC